MSSKKKRDERGARRKLNRPGTHLRLDRIKPEARRRKLKENFFRRGFLLRAVGWCVSRFRLSASPCSTAACDWDRSRCAWGECAIRNEIAFPRRWSPLLPGVLVFPPHGPHRAALAR